MVSWNKGKTKHDHPSILKISRTLAARPRSNFWQWQQVHKPKYNQLNLCKELAEFYGTMLGDGCIEKFPRTEKLTISFNRNEQEHLKHIAVIIEKLFGKSPTVRLRKQAKCDDLCLYQKFLSKRLRFPCGEKLQNKLRIPTWIKENKEYVRHCLKGLFETDGNWSVDKKNHTNVISFKNLSQTLLDDLFKCLTQLGYHPQRRKLDVRLAKHKEVEKFAEWIQFRRYAK